MSQQRRYRLKSNSIGLTRGQLIVVGLAVAVAIAGLILVIKGVVLGAALLGLAGVTISVVTIAAFSRSQKS